MASRKLELRPFSDELNLARLSLVSLQRDVDATQTRWESRIVQGERAYHVECIAPEGIPHGLDSDVVLSIQTLFAEAGLPEDNCVTTTPYGLLKAARLDTNGRNYGKLRESLRRLYLTSYLIHDGWFDARGRRWRFTGKTFRMLEELVFRSSEDLGGDVTLDADGPLRIRLNAQIADNMRAGYTRLPDMKIMQKLEQPTARAMYRVLDGHRYRPEQPEQRVQSLEFSLMEWAEHCRITSDRPDKIRRNLDRMHDELLGAGFLAEVRYDGRGKRQTITYVFGSAARDADPYLVQLLLGVKVSRVMAEKLAREFPERVEEGLALARHIAQTSAPSRNFPGLVVDVIRRLEHYTQPETFVSPKAVTARPARVEPRVPDVEQEILTREQDEERLYRSLPPEFQVEETLRRLNVYFRKRDLTPALCEEVRQAIIGGADGWAMHRALARALARNEDKLATLRGFLD
ncbi:replication initiator protein A [Deinococcus aestuarii]|uniref:replication initiator protein A n=1 Tax=Deinococcus aestuarii TaxID=2774531 RepID=UPI001C0D2412|nr:replication initiator protein A [Deinococcus aestuarii]